jgi:hypothetical protein
MQAQAFLHPGSLCKIARLFEENLKGRALGFVSPKNPILLDKTPSHHCFLSLNTSLNFPPQLLRYIVFV